MLAEPPNKFARVTMGGLKQIDEATVETEQVPRNAAGFHVYHQAGIALRKAKTKEKTNHGLYHEKIQRNALKFELGRRKASKTLAQSGISQTTLVPR